MVIPSGVVSFFTGMLVGLPIGALLVLLLELKRYWWGPEVR